MKFTFLTCVSIIAAFVILHDNPGDGDRPDVFYPQIISAKSADGKSIFELMEPDPKLFVQLPIEWRAFRVLSVGAVRDDLELTDDQERAVIGEYRRLRADLLDVCASHAAGKLTDDEVYVTDLYAASRQAIDEILTEKQKTRLHQIVAREEATMIEFSDLIEAPIWDRIGIELEPVETEQLSDGLVEIQRRLDADIAKARADALQEIINSIPARERPKVERVFGPRFDHSLFKADD